MADNGGMKTKRARRSREQISAIVCEWPRKGLNVAVEAGRHGVSVGTIQRWRKLASGTPAHGQDAEFLEVAVPPTSRSVMPGLRLCWPDGFAVEWMGDIDPETTGALLRGLGRT